MIFADLKALMRLLLVSWHFYPKTEFAAQRSTR
jgi:hypothetical protein